MICQKGHDCPNPYIRTGGWEECRVCRNDRNQAYRRRLAAEYALHPSAVKLGLLKDRVQSRRNPR